MFGRSAVAAMRADAADLDHRRFRREPGGARGILHSLRHGRRSGFADRPTALANQEYDEIIHAVLVDAGDEGVAALDAMHEALLDEKIQSPVDGDGSGSRSQGSPID